MDANDVAATAPGGDKRRNPGDNAPPGRAVSKPAPQAADRDKLQEYIDSLKRLRQAVVKEATAFRANALLPDHHASPAGDELATRFALMQSVNAALLRISEQIAMMTLDANALASALDRLRETEDAIRDLERSLDRRFEELGSLAALLAERESELDRARKALFWMRERNRWNEGWLSRRILSPLRYGAALLSIGGRRTGINASDIVLLEESDLFNPAWYVEHYPDVAASGMNPAEHYLRFGAREGRDPGPGFDTRWYLDNYPDVARSGLNPLVHYLRAGRNEGRTPCKPAEF